MAIVPPIWQWYPRTALRAANSSVKDARTETRISSQNGYREIAATPFSSGAAGELTLRINRCRQPRADLIFLCVEFGQNT